MSKITFFVTLLFLEIAVGKAPIDKSIHNENFEKILEGLEDNKILKSTSRKGEYCKADITENLSSYQQCLNSLCGTPQEFVNYSEYLDNVINLAATETQNIPESFKKRVFPLLKSAVSKEIGRLKKSLEIIKDGTKKYNEPEIRAFRNHVLLSEFSDILRPSLTTPGVYVVDQTVLDGFNFDLSDLEVKTIVNAANEVFPGLTKNSRTIEELKIENPTISLSLALKKEADLFLKKLNALYAKNKDLKDKYEKIISDSVNMNTINSLSNGDDLPSSEVLYILEDIEVTKHFIDIFSSPEKYPALQKMSLFNLDKVVEVFNVKKRVEKKLSELNNNKKIEAKIDEIIARMYSKYALIEVLPTKKELEKFKLEIGKYKKNFLASLSSKYSKQSMKDIAFIVNRLNFKLPPSQDEFKKTIDDKITRLNELLLSVDKNINNYSKKSKELSGLVGLFDYIEDGFDIFYSVENVFGGRGVSSEITDATDTVMGDIMVSWQSVKLSLGEGVIYHEMGHNLYDTFKYGLLSKESFDDFAKDNKCLQNIHKDGYSEITTNMIMTKNNSDGRQFISGFYSHEDYSDLISATAMRKNGPNPACHFLKQDNNLYEQETLINDRSWDVHSSGLFRIFLLEYINNNSLPSSCTQYLKESNQDFPIEDCYGSKNR